MTESGERAEERGGLPAEIVMPSYVEQSYTVRDGEVAGQPAVELSLFSPTGMHVSFLPAGGAIELGLALIETAKRARSTARIIVPDGPVILPGDPRNGKGSG